MDLDENFCGLEFRDRRFLQGKVMETVDLREAVFARSFWDRHDGAMASDVSRMGWDAVG